MKKTNNNLKIRFDRLPSENMKILDGMVKTAFESLDLSSLKYGNFFKMKIGQATEILHDDLNKVRSYHPFRTGADQSFSCFKICPRVWKIDDNKFFATWMDLGAYRGNMKVVKSFFVPNRIKKYVADDLSKEYFESLLGKDPSTDIYNVCTNQIFNQGIRSKIYANVTSFSEKTRKDAFDGVYSPERLGKLCIPAWHFRAGVYTAETASSRKGIESAASISDVFDCFKNLEYSTPDPVNFTSEAYDAKSISAEIDMGLTAEQMIANIKTALFDTFKRENDKKIGETKRQNIKTDLALNSDDLIPNEFKDQYNLEVRDNGTSSVYRKDEKPTRILWYHTDSAGKISAQSDILNFTEYTQLTVMLTTVDELMDFIKQNLIADKIIKNIHTSFSGNN